MFVLHLLGIAVTQLSVCITLTRDYSATNVSLYYTY